MQRQTAPHAQAPFGMLYPIMHGGLPAIKIAVGQYRILYHKNVRQRYFTYCNGAWIPTAMSVMKAVDEVQRLVGNVLCQQADALGDNGFGLLAGFAHRAVGVLHHIERPGQ